MFSFKNKERDLSNINQNNNNSQPPSLIDHLDTACGKFTFYIREDGEFVVTSAFSRVDQDVIDASSTILHMMNSGLLADYFVQSLNLWGDDENERHFIFKIIKKWKLLFDKDEQNKNTKNKDLKLAVDPSDVFGFKELKEK